jgi:hypothetical protein
LAAAPDGRSEAAWSLEMGAGMGPNETDDLTLALQVCAEVRETAESILGNIKLNPGEVLKLLLTSKALRARGLFRGIVSLAEQRLTSPASALIRCLMELKFVTVAVSLNAEHVHDLIATDNGQRARAMKKLLRLPDEHRAANVKPDEIKECLATLGEAQKGPTVSDWAVRANCEDEYNLVYMLLSGDVHPSLRGVEAHLVLDEHGEAQGLTAYPNVDELPFRLMHACDIYLTILSALPDSVLCTSAVETIRRLYADQRKRDINQRAFDAVESI